MSSFLPQVGVCLSVSFLLLGWRDLREDLRRMLEFAGPSRPPLTAIAVHLAASAAFAVVTSWVCTVLLWLVIVARTVLLVLIGPWSATLPDQLAHSHASWFVHFAVLFGLVLAFERAFAHRRDRLAPIEGDAPKPVGRREG